MRIGLDLTHCYQRCGGLQRYAIQLTQALLEIDGANEYVLFCRREVPEELLNAPVRKIVSPITHQVLNEQLWLLGASLRERLDVFHLTGFAGPVLYPGRSVCTIADATPFLFPETVKRSQFLYWRRLMALSARRCNRVITISESSRRDIERFYRVSGRKISVTHLAVAPEFSIIKDQRRLERVRSQYCLPQDFILMVSTLEPRKNYGRMIDAFARIAPDWPNVHLVFAGRPGWLYQPILGRIEGYGLAERAHFVGSVSDEELVALYNMARFLAYPSLYEGFGFPVLEAMACGCPVLTCNTSSMPEVAGDAAQYVDPFDVQSIVAGMLALSNPKRRAELVERGLCRAKNFSWMRTAEMTLSVYQACLGRSRQ